MYALSTLICSQLVLLLYTGKYLSAAHAAHRGLGFGPQVALRRAQGILHELSDSMHVD